MSILKTLLPEGGPFLLAVPASFQKDGKTIHYFKHTAFDTVAALEAQAAVVAATPLDAYFALGSVREVKDKEVRKKANIHQLRTFWLDLDVKAEGNHYRSKREAATDLKAFCTRNGLPNPTIVDSGYGLHVYWRMTEAIEREQWEHYASILKAATEKFGLKADPSRTADCASVLRIPGTVNCKRGVTVPVAAVHQGLVLTPTQLMVALAGSQYDAVKVRTSTEVSPLLGARPSYVGRADINEEATGGMSVDMTEANAKRVVRKCLQLMWQVKNPTKVEEPQWYDMVGCLRHAENGSKAVHAVSSTYAGYSQEETESKIQQHTENGIGPTLCSTFESHNPGGCEGCPFKGKVSTPLQLGKEMKSVDAPVSETPVPSSNVPTKQTLPEPPFPFKRVMDKARGQVAIAYTIATQDGADEEVVIYEHDIYPERIIFDERENKYVVQLRRFLPQDGWETFPVALGKFYDKRGLSTILGDLGVMPDTGRVEALVQYMIGYIRELQKHVKSAVIYAQLGWRDEDRFILGDRVVTAETVDSLDPHRNIVNALSWSEPRGDLAEWRRVMAMYEKPGLEAFQFAAGVAWAAPLFKYTNFNGMIVSMVGPAGCGKSSVMHLVNSVWGNTTHGWVDLQHDTMRAFYNKLGVLKNLPVCYDEVTNLPEDELSDLCYAISKGQGRQRLNQDGSAKENHGNWQTMMLTTSNASLHGRLANAKSDASAEAVRVFEYYVPGGMIPKAEADETLDLLNYNYGLAGEVYIQEVLKDVTAVRGRIKHWTREMERLAKVSSGERFWAAGPACVLAGYEVTNKLGLTKVDLDALVTFCVKSIHGMRGTVMENTRTPTNIVADYMNSHLTSMLVLNAEPLEGKLAMVAQEPHHSLRIRYESWCSKAYVDRSHFREYCAGKSVDWASLKSSLRRQGIMVEEKRVVLGKGTAWKTAQSWVLVFNMAHPEMGGVDPTTSSNAAEIVGTAMANAQQG